MNQILSSEWLPERERAYLVRWEFHSQSRSQVFLKIFFAKERSSRQAAKRVEKRRGEREKKFPSGTRVPGFQGSSPTRRGTKERGSFSALVPEEKVLSAIIINPLLTRFARSRRLDIVPFFSSSSLSIKTQKGAWGRGGSLSKGVSQRRTSNGSEAFCL